MDTIIALTGLDVALNPAVVGVMVVLGYLTWLAITRETSPFVRSFRRARRNVLRLGRRCASVVAVSWLVTLPHPERSLARDVVESVAFAAAVLLCLGLLGLVRAFLRERAERPSAAQGPEGPAAASAALANESAPARHRASASAGTRVADAAGGRVRVRAGTSPTASGTPGARAPAVPAAIVARTDPAADRSRRRDAPGATPMADESERRTAVKLARRERRARLELEGRLANVTGETLRRNAASAGGTGPTERRGAGGAADVPAEGPADAPPDQVVAGE